MRIPHHIDKLIFQSIAIDPLPDNNLLFKAKPTFVEPFSVRHVKRKAGYDHKQAVSCGKAAEQCLSGSTLESTDE